MAALANSSVGVQRLLLLHDAHVTPLADTEPRALRARCNLLDDEVHELEERVTIVSGRVNELLTTSVPVMPIEQICAALRQAMLVGRPAQAAFTEPGLPPQVWAPPEAAPDDLDE